MNYQEYKPRSGLEAVIKCYWTLEVAAEAKPKKQRIIPDGCLEMVFILGEAIKRYTSEEAFIIQPRAFVLGQITKPFFVEPTGYVNSFAVRFYPYGFANLISMPLNNFANQEVPLAELFNAAQAERLQKEIADATNAEARIKIIERFFLRRLENEQAINSLVRATVDAILSTSGGTSIKATLKNDISKRRQLERNFLHQVGMSPKQLGKVVRLQTAIKMMLEQQPDNLNNIANNSDYYDQAHFIKDFKEFTGTTPKEFFEDEGMELSTFFYK